MWKLKAVQLEDRRSSAVEFVNRWVSRDIDEFDAITQTRGQAFLKHYLCCSVATEAENFTLEWDG